MKMQTFDSRSGAILRLPATTSNVRWFRASRVAFRVVISVAAVLLAVSIGAAAAQQAATPSSPSSKASGQKMTQIFIPTSLSKTLDSKKSKTGEEVVFKVAGVVHLPNGTVISHGKVIGHVTEAKARSGSDTESSLTIALDKIELPSGENLPVTGIVQAVAPNPNADDSGGGVDYGSSLNRTMEHTQSGVSSSASVAILTDQSVGVYGIKNLQLSPEGVLKTDGKMVKLAEKSQVLLRVQIAAGS